MDREEGTKCEVEVEIETPYSQTLEKAVQPDNVMSPPWLRIECEAFDSKLRCLISVDCRDSSRILSLRNTIDDLLISIKSALQTLESINARMDKA